MPAGRPTIMTETVLGKLQEAFAYDATIEEACFYADINPDTYYTYAKVNKEFSERVAALRQRPVLAARKKIVSEIETDVNVAKWYLERKRKAEFASRSELTGADGEALPAPIFGGLSVTNNEVDEESDAREDLPV